MKQNQLTLVFQDASYDWQKRRSGQVYSYAEVLREVTRRMKGDYQLSEAERIPVRNAAIMKAATRFHFAALFSDLLDAHELTAEDFLSLCGCNGNDTADTLVRCILDPFYKSENTPISIDDQIDEIYPGRKVLRS